MIDAQKPANETLAVAEAKVVELGAQVKTLTDKLALQKVAMGNAMPKGLERLADGGIRLPVTVDKDMAEPLLSWAHDAGEEPEAYIGKVLADALVSVVSS